MHRANQRMQAKCPPHTRPAVHITYTHCAPPPPHSSPQEKKPYSGQLEPMLLQHVVPLFESPHGHLRCGARWRRWRTLLFRAPAASRCLLPAACGSPKPVAPGLGYQDRVPLRRSIKLVFIPPLLLPPLQGQGLLAGGPLRRHRVPGRAGPGTHLQRPTAARRGRHRGCAPWGRGLPEEGRPPNAPHHACVPGLLPFQ